MANNYIEEGKRIVFTAGAEVKSGDLVMVGSLAVVSLGNLANGARSAGEAVGVYELAGKDNTLAIDQGQKVYRVIADGKLTNVPDDALYVGIAWEAAALAATSVKVKLNA